MQEASTVRIYAGSENNWTGYEQLAGSRYTSTKRAELEVLSCVRGYHVYKKIKGSSCWRALTRSKEPTNASVR